MPTIKERINKNGEKVYKIEVSVNKEGKRRTLSRTYTPISGMRQKEIEKAVQKMALEMEDDLRNGRLETMRERIERELAEKMIADQIPTFKEYIENVFKKGYYSSLSYGTKQGYNNIINKLYEKFGNVKIDKITFFELENIAVEWENKLEYSTYNTYISKVKTIFEYAYKKKVIEENPAEKLDTMCRPKDTVEKKKALSLDEIKMFRKELENEPILWRCFFEVLLDTGARIGEVRALRWCCIDFANSMITVDKTLVSEANKGPVMHNTKTGTTRCVEIGEDIVDLLTALKAAEEWCDDNDYIFNHGGIPYSYYSARNRLIEIGERIGIEGLHPHQFRHTSASLALQGGADILGISQRLGHAKPSTTVNTYLHGGQEQSNRAGRAMRKMLDVK